MIGELEVLVVPVSGFSRGIVLIEVDLFVLEPSAEPFREDVVNGLAFSIHTHLDASRDEPVQIAIAGKVAPLIAVKDDGNRRSKSPVHSQKDEGHFERLIEGPGDHVAGLPVHNCDESIQPLRRRI